MVPTRRGRRIGRRRSSPARDRDRDRRRRRRRRLWFLVLVLAGRRRRGRRGSAKRWADAGVRWRSPC